MADAFFYITIIICLDMRFQGTMPDVLHWLGIKKIDNMISMSNLKHDAVRFTRSFSLFLLTDLSLLFRTFLDCEFWYSNY